MNNDKDTDDIFNQPPLKDEDTAETSQEGRTDEKEEKERKYADTAD